VEEKLIYCMKLKDFPYVAWHNSLVHIIQIPFFFPMAQETLVGQGLLIIETSRSHSRDTTVFRTPLEE